MGRSKSNLLSLSVVVCGISIESDLADGNQRVVRVWPNLGYIEDIKSVSSGIFFWHGLNEPVPAWVVALSNLVVEIIGAPLRVLNTLRLSLSCSEVLNALARLVVVLDEVDLAFGVDPSKSVR